MKKKKKPFTTSKRKYNIMASTSKPLWSRRRGYVLTIAGAW